jgi:hypothetical protein
MFASLTQPILMALILGEELVQISWLVYLTVNHSTDHLDMFRVFRDPDHHLLCTLLYFWLHCLLVQCWAKIKWCLPSQACCSLHEDHAFTYLGSYGSWALAKSNSTSESSNCFRHRRETQHAVFLLIVCPEYWADYCRLTYTGTSRWWSQWRVMASSCHSLWRWQYDTLWLTLTRLRLHEFILVVFVWFSWSSHIVIFKVLVLSFLCNLNLISM